MNQRVVAEDGDEIQHIIKVSWLDPVLYLWARSDILNLIQQLRAHVYRYVRICKHTTNKLSLKTQEERYPNIAVKDDSHFA